MYRLMIKRHLKTGLKYLCITKRRDHESYVGSGKYWKNHIKKYGKQIHTEVIYESENYTEFLDKCYHYSEIYDIVNSDDWANAIPETGYGGGNFASFWKSLDDETKRELIIRRNSSIKKNHWSLGECAEEIRKIISSVQIDTWKNLTEDQQIIRMEKLRSFKGDITDTTREKLSAALRCYASNRPMEHNVNISIGRLNMTERNKEIRKSKIRETYSTGKHDHLFERYSKERIGGNNPSAKPIIVDDVEYSCIKDAVDILNMPRSKINRYLKSENHKNWRYK